MPLADVPVVRIVRGCDLEEARGVLRLGVIAIASHDDVVVLDDWDAPPNNGKGDERAAKFGSAGIVRVHRDRGIAEHCLWTCGRDRHMAASVLEWISQIPHVPSDLFHLYFVVGQCGLRDRIPVHQPLASLDQAILKQTEEGVPNSGGAHGVHCEACTLPITTGAEFLKLAQDDLLVLVLPFLRQGDEILPAHVGPSLSGLHQTLLHDGLRGDSRVIGTG